jgi:hypothetical protein
VEEGKAAAAADAAKKTNITTLAGMYGERNKYPEGSAEYKQWNKTINEFKAHTIEEKKTGRLNIGNTSDFEKNYLFLRDKGMSHEDILKVLGKKNNNQDDKFIDDALKDFLQGNPTATSEDIRNFTNRLREGRSGKPVQEIREDPRTLQPRVEQPTGGATSIIKDNKSGKNYYYNGKTGQILGEVPEEKNNIPQKSVKTGTSERDSFIDGKGNVCRWVDDTTKKKKAGLLSGGYYGVASGYEKKKEIIRPATWPEKVDWARKHSGVAFDH